MERLFSLALIFGRINFKYRHLITMELKIVRYEELHVYQNALEGTMRIFEISKRFPPEEKYSLTDQIRRSSRSVCANIAKAWRKRRYTAAFVAKINDAEESDETQAWVDIAKRCQYLSEAETRELKARYDYIIRQLVLMSKSPEKWSL